MAAAEAAMIAEFAPAKVNLALHVLARRADGYHELDSVVAFADVGDRIEIEPAADFAIAASGPFAHLLPPPDRNIIRHAWDLMAAFAAGRGRELTPVRVSLVKNLPVAAGIGGGSANAAAALRAFARMLDVADTAELAAPALRLGADVPVCLVGRACRMGGIGERTAPLADFATLPAVLANPMVEVPTAAVFQALGLACGQSHRAPIARLDDAAGWRNDLSAAAATVAPAIAGLLESFAAQPGLRYARMSGSGATCFGIFDTHEAAARAAMALSATHPSYWCRAATLR